MTSYLDEFLKQPGRMAAELRRELEKEEGEGEITTQEKEELERALAPPEDRDKSRYLSTRLRGEGGSGEVKRSVEVEIREQRDAFGRNLEEVRDESGEGGSTEGDPTFLEETAVSSERGSSWSILHHGQEEIKAYCEQNFRLLNSTLVAFQDRLARLEARDAPSIPLSVLPGSPPRANRLSLGGSSRLGRPPLGEGGGEKRPRPVIPRDAVERFIRDNGAYPSFKGVRSAKLKALALSVGVGPPQRDLTPSEWSVGGVYSALSEEE